MFHTAFDDWIVGVFGILGMAFFIGCTSCWQHKSSHPGGRRQPPPPPTPDLQPRYEHGPYSPNRPPEAAADHIVPQKTRTGTNDEDFEDFRAASAEQKANVKGQKSQKSAEDKGARQDTYVNLDAAQDYENVPERAVNEDHVYLKILESHSETDVTTADKEKEENKTPRSAINSIGKYSSHSDSLCHSYENVAMEGAPRPLEPDLDYVNVSPSE